MHTKTTRAARSSSSNSILSTATTTTTTNDVDDDDDDFGDGGDGGNDDDQQQQQQHIGWKRVARTEIFGIKRNTHSENMVICSWNIELKTTCWINEKRNKIDTNATVRAYKQPQVQQFFLLVQIQTHRIFVSFGSSAGDLIWFCCAVVKPITVDSETRHFLWTKRKKKELLDFQRLNLTYCWRNYRQIKRDKGQRKSLTK